MINAGTRWVSCSASSAKAGRLPWLAAATPHIDRLASEGLRFRNAFVVSSLCSPSRAAFLTGAYNHLNGVANNHTPFPLDKATYASLLRAAGYRTGYFGKWHMGSQRERPGFAEYASFVGQGRLHQRTIPGERRHGPDCRLGGRHQYRLCRRFHPPSGGATPFALVLGFKSPHVPITPPARLATEFPDAALGVPGNATSYGPYDPTPVPSATSPADVQNYSRTIVGVDQNVGRVLAALDASGMAQNTVVVFASDNGFFLDEHGIGLPPGTSGNKRAAYQESIRIPLLIRYPSARPQRRRPRPDRSEHRSRPDGAGARGHRASVHHAGQEPGRHAQRQRRCGARSLPLRVFLRDRL